MLRLILTLSLLFGACGHLLYAKLGDNVTLPCHYGPGDTANYVCWYRQLAGESPRSIFSFYRHAPTALTFYNNFDEKRYSIHAGKGFYHLNLSNVQHSDVGMYYCGKTTVQFTEHNEGTFLALRDQTGMSFLQQSDSLSAERGASTSLKCTVLAGTVGANHTVYWFKKDSGEPHMGILYVHSHSGQCVQSSLPARQSCVYSLSKDSVKQSDSGLYYCAVASCGEIVFGKGRRLDVAGSQREASPVRTHVIAGLLVSVVLNLILLGVLYQKLWRKSHQSQGSQRQQSTPEHATEIQNEDQSAVQYVALGLKKGRGTSRKQKNADEETIYARVKVSDTG